MVRSGLLKLVGDPQDEVFPEMGAEDLQPDGKLLG